MCMSKMHMYLGYLKLYREPHLTSPHLTPPKAQGGRQVIRNPNPNQTCASCPSGSLLLLFSSPAREGSHQFLPVPRTSPPFPAPHHSADHIISLPCLAFVIAMTSYALESTLFVQRVEAFLSLHGPTANGRLGQAVPLPPSLRTRGMSYMKILQEASTIRIETSTAHYNGNAARARVGWTAHLRTSDPLTTHNRELGSSGALPAQNQTTPTVGGADCVRTVRRVVRNGNAPNVSEEDPAHLGKRRRDESGDGQGEAGPST